MTDCLTHSTSVRSSAIRGLAADRSAERALTHFCLPEIVHRPYYLPLGRFFSRFGFRVVAHSFLFSLIVRVDVLKIDVESYFRQPSVRCKCLSFNLTHP